MQPSEVVLVTVLMWGWPPFGYEASQDSRVTQKQNLHRHRLAMDNASRGSIAKTCCVAALASQPPRQLRCTPAARIGHTTATMMR